jgi:hypothetical protein
LSEFPKTIKEQSGPRLVAEVQTSSLAGRRFAFVSAELRGGILLGRAPDCNLRFDPNRDLKVSGHHAQFIETRQGIFVRDKGSSNGVYVNGQRVTGLGIRVYDGSEVSLGQEGALLRLSIPGEPPPQPPTPEVTPAPEPASAPLTRIERRGNRGRNRLLLGTIAALAVTLIVLALLYLLDVL